MNRVSRAGSIAGLDWGPEHEQLIHRLNEKFAPQTGKVSYLGPEKIGYALLHGSAQVSHSLMLHLCFAKLLESTDAAGFYRAKRDN